VLEIYEKEKMTGGYADSITLCWFDDGLNQTQNTQVAMLAAGYATYQVLEHETGLSPGFKMLFTIAPCLSLCCLNH
jgi:malonyl CoA-acyl carrier protein transacylase